MIASNLIAVNFSICNVRPYNEWLKNESISTISKGERGFELYSVGQSSVKKGCFVTFPRKLYIETIVAS